MEMIDALVIDGKLFLYCRGKRELEIALRLLLTAVRKTETLDDTVRWRYWERGQVQRERLYLEAEEEGDLPFARAAAARLAMFTGDVLIGPADGSIRCALESAPMDGALALALPPGDPEAFVGEMREAASAPTGEPEVVFLGALASEAEEG